MAEMQHNGPQTPKKRPRARTWASFPSILKSPKSELSPATSAPIERPLFQMSLEDIITALTPPAVLSPAHARALALVLETETPQLDTLMPVLARLCAPGVSSLFLAAGLDAISACAASEAHSPSDIERASLFAILGSSDRDWTPETWMPRYRCLLSLTREGQTVEGFETAFLHYAEDCITSTFESLLSDDKFDRIPKEKYIESVSHVIRKTLKQNKTLYEQNLQAVLVFFEGFVQRSLTSVPVCPQPCTTSIPFSPPEVTQTLGPHRRNASASSGLTFHSGNQPPPREPVSPPDQTLLPITLYISFLDMYGPQIAPCHFRPAVSILVRIIGVHLSPLPRLSTLPTPHHQARPAEEAALKQLFACLTGPYADGVAAYIRGLLASANWQEALGAFRVVRLVLRDTAVSRMACRMLQRPRFAVEGFASTGRLVANENIVDVLENTHKAASNVSGLRPDRIASAAGKSVREWVARSDAEKVLEEALGIVEDVMVEASDRAEDKEDTEYYSLDDHEGRFVGTVLNETVKYVQRVRMSQKTPLFPIDNPTTAPTPLLLSLCTQLALPMSTPMTPSLPFILLSLASHLTDTQTEPIPQNMYALGLLAPTSTVWLRNFTELYNVLVGRSRPLTSRKVLAVAQSVHTDLMNAPQFRRKLATRLCELTEQALERDGQENGAEMDGDEYWFRLCTNEFVWGILEPPPPPYGDETPAKQEYDEDMTEDIIGLFVRYAESGCPCTTLDMEDIPPVPPSPSQDSIITSTPGMSLPSSTSGTPVLSRVTSEYSSQDKDALSPPSASSGLVLPPFRPMLPRWSMSRNREPEAPHSPVTTHSEADARESCRPLWASISLIAAFQRLSFMSPPQSAHSVQLFKVLLSILANARCPKARLAMLQFLMRLRADRDHRIYVLENLNEAVDSLAALVDRCRLTSSQTSPNEADLRRARSASRGLRRGKAGSPIQSRSRSRPAPPVLTLPARSKRREPLWMNPEVLPFDIPVSEPSSNGVATYDVNAPPESEESKHWLPVSDYVFALIDIFTSETDWEIVSYVLCHLPLQLANKHFFCGPKTKDGIVALLTTLCTAMLKGETWSAVAERMPESLRQRDAHGLVYHTLTVLISYKTTFDRQKYHDMLVEAFMSGLSSQPSTVKICLNALSVCAFELPSSITKNMSHILEKLSRVITNAPITIHIFDFISIVGSLPSLYANFREQEFRLVFAMAVTYIDYHNTPDTRGLSGRESFALSQHVVAISYHIIYVWFLAVPLPDRPNHVDFVTRRLVLANEAKDQPDEATQVCFDWLGRYAYASADPRPTRSLLSEILMNPPQDENDEPVSLPSKTWIWGNAIVTIRTLPKRGWMQVEFVRPSGEAKFLCRLENFPQVDPGDFDPDKLTDVAIMMSDRDPTEMEMDVPDPDDDQDQDAMSKEAIQRVRDIFFLRERPGEIADPPDPLTGYVWSRSAPSQRRKKVALDPSFFPLQLSQYPYLPMPTTRSEPISSSPQLDAVLRTLELTPVIDTHKIAILYVGPGQKEEQEILGNCDGSPMYTRFLESMGRLIRVRDQRDISTGDLIPETDGEYAYVWWDDLLQVVYHTATLMPNIPTDPGFMNKKRHVGSDKVRIVWNDSGLPYAFDTIPSAFNFVNFVIEPHSIGTIASFLNSRHEHEVFKVTMQRMAGMPEFGPIGDYKLVSANSLGPLLRQVSLLAAFFCEVYEATDKDTSTQEYITNWRRRLQYISTFRRCLESEPLSEQAEDDGVDADSGNVRDFTRFF